MKFFPRDTFLGQIQGDLSGKEHLNIISIVSDFDAHYCSCTSQDKDKYNERLEISKEIMRKYFPQTAKKTFIIFHPKMLKHILQITLHDRIQTGEFTAKAPFEKELFDEILKRMLNMDSFSEEFKKDINNLAAE